MSIDMHFSPTYAFSGAYVIVVGTAKLTALQGCWFKEGKVRNGRGAKGQHDANAKGPSARGADSCQAASSTLVIVTHDGTRPKLTHDGTRLELTLGGLTE